MPDWVHTKIQPRDNLRFRCHLTRKLGPTSSMESTARYSSVIAEEPVEPTTDLARPAPRCTITAKRANARFNICE